MSRVYDGDRYVVKQLPDDGTRGYRLEIDEFLADNDVTNIFLLALSELQQRSLDLVTVKRKDGVFQEPNWLNYYALAGVHGAPRDDWDGVTNDASVGPFGYCNHGENTFPTWHRPYMLAYEYAIHEEMIYQAKKYPSAGDQARYLAAAARFRLPYWDPIMPRYERQGSAPKSIWGLPELFKHEKAWVHKPGSSQPFDSIDNPMYQFTFPKPADFTKADAAKREKLTIPSYYNPTKTVRTPDPVTGEFDAAYLDYGIQQNANEYATNIWKMLSPDISYQYQDTDSSGRPVQLKIENVNQDRKWPSFANHSMNSDTFRGPNGRQVRVPTVSLEGWHDGIHGLIGTGRSKQNRNNSGMMGDPVWAGFEPMFWMHHNNIDRLLALYQALYGKNVDAQEFHNPLMPFRRVANASPNNTQSKPTDFYNSDDGLAKNYWLPGFAVPGSKQGDPAVVKANVKKYLTDTYYWATGSTLPAKPLAAWPKDLSGSQALYGANAKPSSTPIKTFTALDQDGKLVARRAAAAPEPESAFDTEDTPIPTAKVLEHAAIVDQAAPAQVVSAVPEVPQNAYRVWDARITTRKYAFDEGSYNIHIFIGWVKDDQAERFMTKKNEVSFMTVFASGADAACGNCKKARAEGLKVEGVVPLTMKLSDYLESNPISEGLIAQGELKKIENMEPEAVVPFLTEHLQWRMTDMSSNILAGEEQNAELEIMVTSRAYIPPQEGNLLGVYGPPTIYAEITSNKAGGFGHVYP